MLEKKMLVKTVHQVASTAHVTKYHTGVPPCMRACANVFPLTITLSVYRRSMVGVHNWRCSLTGKALEAGYNYVQKLVVRVQPSRFSH